MKSDPSQNRLKKNWILEDEEISFQSSINSLTIPDSVPPNTQITFSFATDPNFCPKCKSIHRINPRCLFHHKTGNIVIHELYPECKGKGHLADRIGYKGFIRSDQCLCWKCKGTGQVYQVTERRY